MTAKKRRSLEDASARCVVFGGAQKKFIVYGIVGLQISIHNNGHI